ncbi:MAG: SET domain-containing protein [Nanoarchaeota archaeon]|nr:SET domain-containing protein [Nanoarchaeota archaeon]
MYVSEKIEVRDTKKGKSLFVIDEIVKNEVIFEFERRFLKNPTRTSMQIDDNVHQEATDSDALENFLNHSCKPNGYIEFQDLTYRALRPIKKGEELTFNYNTTEWDMGKGFQCQCEYNSCYGQITGFKYLTHKQQKELEPLLSPFLKKKLKEAESQPTN